MMIRWLLLSLLILSANVQAGESLNPVTPPGLLPTETARSLLEQDPSVAAARAGLDVALQEAGILDKSPYEWIPRVSGQQRRLENGPHYNEWNVGIERTIRLPGKAAADRNIGKAAIEESQARYGEALHEAARELLALWVDWLAAERTRELAESNFQSTQTNLTAVEKRVRAGDASKLDLSIARAEMAEQKRLDNDAKTLVNVTWLRLSTRFPGIKRQSLPLPMPLTIMGDMASWRERILSQSDELRLVRTQMQMAEARAERIEAEKTPDPTFALYTASEAGGNEHFSGITVSIPIPGDIRDSRSAKAIAEVEVSRQEVELSKRQLETEIASAIENARGAYDSMQIATEGASAMQENASFMQRAYTLAEADLQALLFARRQATAASNTALQAQVTALKAYYGLLVDARLVWDLAHE